jgi:hypothetical protein
VLSYQTALQNAKIKPVIGQQSLESCGSTLSSSHSLGCFSTYNQGSRWGETVAKKVGLVYQAMGHFGVRKVAHTGHARWAFSVMPCKVGRSHKRIQGEGGGLSGHCCDLEVGVRSEVTRYLYRNSPAASGACPGVDLLDDGPRRRACSGPQATPSNSTRLRSFQRRTNFSEGGPAFGTRSLQIWGILCYIP